MKKRFNKFKIKKYLGIILIIIGIIIMVTIMPTNVWIFLIGLLLLVIGIFLFKT